MATVTLYTYRARIVHVYDGDSCTVDVDLGMKTWKKDVKLRLYGIDTPEVRGPGKPEGIVVRELVRRWLPIGTEVTLQTHKDRTGKFGRWLATIWIDGWGESLNDRLLNGGYAREYLP